MASRYFPMTHEFNSDPEGWQLTDEFGDRSLRIWIEILAILDREKNNWKLVSGWDSVISRKVRQSPATVRRVVGWMLANGWLEVGQLSANGWPEVGQLSANGWPEVLRARNYHKFHKIASDATPPPNLTYPNHPNHPNHKNQEPAAPEPSADSAKAEKKKLDPRIREVATKVYETDKKKFERLVVWIKQAEKEHFSVDVIVAALERFLPYARDIAQWYPYLDKLLYKCDQDINRDRHEAEHKKHKEEIRELSNSPIYDMVARLADAKSK